MVEEENASKPPLMTVLLLLGVILVVGGLLSLYGALGFSIGMTAFGSLFLLYWAGLQHQAWPDFVPALIGGLVGIGLAWLLLTGPQLWGTAGAVAGFAVLGVALYFYLRGEVRLVVNNATMLILLVATIPELRVGDNALRMAASLAIGAAWIGVISWIAAQARLAWARRSA
jgi:hypothetical protein